MRNMKGSDVWEEAQRFYHACLENVFEKIGKGVPPGSYDKLVRQLLTEGEEARTQKADRPQVDRITRKDPGTRNMAVSTDLHPLHTSLRDHNSCSSEGSRRGRSPKTSPLADTPHAEEADEDNGEEDPCSLGQPTEAVGALTDERTHTEHIPSQSEITETSQSATGSLFSARPKPPYSQNVVGRMVWFRPKRGEMFWIRGRIEKCKRVLVDKVKEDGKVSTSESVFHFVRCSDDDRNLYRVKLQQIEEPDNLVWM